MPDLVLTSPAGLILAPGNERRLFGFRTERDDAKAKALVF
jgi:hypothetical protein